MAPPSSFNPTAATHLALLNDWMDPSHSLRALADRYQTTIADLCFFFARPEITAQLSLLHAAAYNRARLTATTHLDSALSAMALIVRRFLAEQANPDPTLTPEQRHRAEETGRRVATILLRFIKNKPATLSATSPAPAGEVSRAQRVTEGVRPKHAEAPPSLTPISTTDLAQAALEALASARPDVHAATAPPNPPPTPAPNPQPETPTPISEHPTSDIPHPTSTAIQDFLNAHLPSEHPTSAIPHPTSPPNEHWP